MSIPVTNIPVLTGEVAERFIEQCEYNAKYLRGSEWKGEFKDIFSSPKTSCREINLLIHVRQNVKVSGSDVNDDMVAVAF